jgi:hypothetical protein
VESLGNLSRQEIDMTCEASFEELAGFPIEAGWATGCCWRDSSGQESEEPKTSALKIESNAGCSGPQS